VLRAVFLGSVTHGPFIYTRRSGRARCPVTITTLAVTVAGTLWRRQAFTRTVGWLVGVEFNAPLDTTEVISEAVFTANHLTDTDKQNSTGKYRYRSSIQIRKSKQPKIQQNKTTLVQLPLTTLGQETRWAYSTMLRSPHENGWMVPFCRQPDGRGNET